MEDCLNKDEDKCKKEKPKQRNKVQKQLSKLSKEQLSVALKKKKECNAKAQAIVEEFLDPVENTDAFTEKLKYINQDHFEDIVIERAIIKLCGYPLCNNQLDNIPTKQYHISVTTNKVYDITKRKNFCSNNCFKSSIYLKEQLLTSPLWMRDAEILPEFKLLSLD